MIDIIICIVTLFLVVLFIFSITFSEEEYYYIKNIFIKAADLVKTKLLYYLKIIKLEKFKKYLLWK